jgi:DNA-binding NarL/FixJ family response regulator
VKKSYEQPGVVRSGTLAGWVRFYLSSQLADLIQAALEGRGHPPERPELSPREQEALSFIARGFTHQQTATRMGVSTATVNTYVARIRAKLQLGNKAELALAALRYLKRPHAGK